MLISVDYLVQLDPQLRALGLVGRCAAHVEERRLEERRGGERIDSRYVAVEIDTWIYI